MSAVLYTSSHFDTPEVLVAELLENMQPCDPAHTIGILLCDSLVDCPSVLKQLGGRLSFPIVGGTALAFPVFGAEGEEISASLLVISSAAMKFAISVSEPLNEAEHEGQMARVFADCLERLGETPRLILPFFPLMPGVLTDRFVSELFDMAGEIPVFGGVTTNDLISTKAAVFAQGEFLPDRMALVMLGGDIRPVFAASNVVTKMAEYAPVVTKSQGNDVYCVDDMSFCDYMKTLGLSPEDRINGVDALMQYGPIPVRMHRPDQPDDGVPEVRCISYTNIEKGSVVFSGGVPEGTRVSVSILRKEDVEESTRLCAEQLKSRMAAEEARGAAYSVALCVSCVARYFVLVGGDNVERACLARELPASLPASGYYAFCEIGPTLLAGEGKVFNRSHSASIVMCAF